MPAKVILELGPVLARYLSSSNGLDYYFLALIKMCRYIQPFTQYLEQNGLIYIDA